MKTLVKGGVSIYIFEDAEVVNIGSNNITVGDPLTLTIADCSSLDTVMHTSVSPPVGIAVIVAEFAGSP